MKHPTLLIVLTALALTAPLAQAAQPGLECDPGLLAHAPPEVSSWDSQSPFVTIYDGSSNRATVPLGIGRISAFWWEGRHVRLPLHDQPGAEPWGWFADGWLALTGSSAGEPAPVGLEGAVETDYEETSFIVYDSTSDGWLRLRYGRPSENRDGTAWVDRCHLARESLSFEPWQERFLSDEISPLYIRDRTPRPLRAAPNNDAKEIVRIEGDWMRVRLKTPSDYCFDPDEVRTEEGWIRWRASGRGVGAGALGSDQESQRLGQVTLLAIQSEKGQLSQTLLQELRARQMPQVGTACVPAHEDLAKLVAQRAVRIDPGDPGE